MSVFQTIRVPVPEDQWIECHKCEGHGTRKVGINDYLQCDNPGCDHGIIKTKVVRASKAAIQTAQEKAEDAENSIRRR